MHRSAKLLQATLPPDGGLARQARQHFTFSFLSPLDRRQGNGAEPEAARTDKLLDFSGVPSLIQTKAQDNQIL